LLGGSGLREEKLLSIDIVVTDKVTAIFGKL